MPRQGSVRKYAEWEERLHRFETSGMTVVEFCRKEGATSHQFYYWLRRVRGGSRGASTHSRSSQEVVNRAATAGRGRAKPRTGATEALSGDSPVARTPPMSQEPLVHFTLNSTLQVSVPARCLEAIRCVLQFAGQDEPDEPSSGNVARRFRQVVVAE